MKLLAFALAATLAGCASADADSIKSKPGPAAATASELSPDAGAPAAPAGVMKADKPLDLGNWKGAHSPDDLGAAFAAQIEVRYGPEPGLQAVKKDLQANGFSCRDVAPVEARSDYLLATCDRQEMHKSCNNIWSVSLRFDHSSRALDSTRVTPNGGFERLCLGATPQ